jgi:hypothetical protein
MPHTTINFQIDSGATVNVYRWSITYIQRQGSTTGTFGKGQAMATNPKNGRQYCT